MSMQFRGRLIVLKHLNAYLIFTEILCQYFQPHVLADLPGPLQRIVNRGSNRRESQNNDIYCIVKKHICSEEFAQRPLLVLTKLTATDVIDLPPGKHDLRSVSADVKGDWLKLATAVQSFYGPSYAPASQYLRRLADGFFHHTSIPCQLPWLTVVDERAFPEPVMNLHKCILDASAPSAQLRAVWARPRQQQWSWKIGRCQPKHSVHTLLIFWYSHSIKRTRRTWSQSVRLTIFNFTFKGLLREHNSFQESDSQESNPSHIQLHIQAFAESTFSRIRTSFTQRV